MPVFRSIQYLRALAALAVLVFHAMQRAGAPVTVAAAGVDVFFVISGFIMGSTVGVLTAGAASPGRFLLHRLIRIAPLYWAVTLALAVAATVPGLLPNLRASASHLALSLLFIPHLDPAGGIFPLLVPGWTLDYEMAFYLVFAAALWLPRRRRLFAVTAALGGLVAAGALFRLSGALWQTYTDPILLEFAAGLALAVAAARGRLPGRPASAALAAVGAAAFAAQPFLPESGPAWRLLLWGLPALLIVTGALGLERRAESWLGAVLFKLGGASYAIYLLHGMVVSACWRLLHGAPLPVFVGACLAGSALLGLGCHVMVERPVTLALRRVVDGPSWFSPPGRRLARKRA